MPVLGAAFPNYMVTNTKLPQMEWGEHPFMCAVGSNLSCQMGVREVLKWHGAMTCWHPPTPPHPKHPCFQWAAGVTHSSGLLFPCCTLVEQALAKNGCVKTVACTDGECAWTGFPNVQIRLEWSNRSLWTLPLPGKWCVGIPKGCSKSTTHEISLQVALYRTNTSAFGGAKPSFSGWFVQSHSKQSINRPADTTQTASSACLGALSTTRFFISSSVKWRSWSTGTRTERCVWATFAYRFNQ